MNALSDSQIAEIKAQHGPAEFGKFQQTLINVAEEYNGDVQGGTKFDLSEADGEESGTIHFGDSSFEFGLDPGEPEYPEADIVYRFRRTSSPASGAERAPEGNGNGGTSSKESQKTATEPKVQHATQHDPRNTPMMRYQPQILGAGTSPGQFAFYWDGESTDELAESLLREFVEWMR